MTFTEELEVDVREWCEMKAAGSLGGEKPLGVGKEVKESVGRG